MATQNKGSKGTKGSKGNASAPKHTPPVGLPEKVAALMARKSETMTDEDWKALRKPGTLILAFPDAYNVGGIATESGNDTRKIASSPGRFTWLQGDVAKHPSGRRLGFKATVILSKPIVEREGAEPVEESNRTMSALL